MEPDREVEVQREEEAACQWPTQLPTFLGNGWGLGEWVIRGLLGVLLTTAGQNCEGEEFLHTQAGPERDRK